MTNASLRAFALSGIFLFCSACISQEPAPPTPSPNPSQGQDIANDLTVTAGKSVLVDSARPIQRVALGAPEMAEATAVSPTEVMVNGKQPGETTLILWQKGGTRQFFNLRVQPSAGASVDHLDAVRRELRSELPGQRLQLTWDNGNIFLHGTVKDMISSDRAVKIASTAGKVVNLLYVSTPPIEQQILLKVRFASLDRSTTEQLGLNIFSTGATNSIGTVTTQQFSPPTVSSPTPTSPATATLSNLLNLYIFRPDLNLGATLAALESKGLLQILAEPNLLAANGRQGSFLAGGEYPYPVVQGAGAGGVGAVTIQFREYGIRLNFIPTIMPNGTIRLQVSPEVSSLDFANGVTITGFTVPGISTRKVDTEVDLKDGQSFVIGGLLDDRETKTLSKIPFIGDIPVLGKLFNSIQKTKNHTELIVIVTPELVGPAPAGAAMPSLKYPDKFLKSDAGPVRTPGAEVTGVQPVPVPAAVPIERVIDSLKPEQPLQLNNTTPGAYFGSGATGASGATTGVNGLPPQ